MASATPPTTRTPPAGPPTPQPPRDLGTRILRNGVGIVLLLFGLVGLFLPVLQGILLIGIGLLFIDLPIKSKAHRWLWRYGWYRKLARQHDKLLDRWRNRDSSGRNSDDRDPPSSQADEPEQTG